MKSNSVKYHLLIGTLVLFVLANILHSDVFIKEKIQRSGFQMMDQSQAGEKTERTMWISSDKIRSDDKDQSFIMHFDKNVFYIINHKEKSYMEMPMNMGDLMKGKMEKEGIKEEDMEKYMKMAPGMSKLKISVTATGEKKKIGNWNCKKYIQKIETMMGPTTSEIWATEDLKMDYELYTKFSSAFLGQQPGAQQMSSEIAEEMKKIKGVPVLTTTTVEMMGTSMKSSQELVEFKEGTAPTGIFDLPKSYKKKKMESF